VRCLSRQSSWQGKELIGARALVLLAQVFKQDLVFCGHFDLRVIKQARVSCGLASGPFRRPIGPVKGLGVGRV
jgi:hypothetical protein